MRGRKKCQIIKFKRTSSAAELILDSGLIPFRDLHECDESRQIELLDSAIGCSQEGDRIQTCSTNFREHNLIKTWKASNWCKCFSNHEHSKSNNLMQHLPWTDIVCMEPVVCLKNIPKESRQQAFARANPISDRSGSERSENKAELGCALFNGIYRRCPAILRKYFERSAKMRE